MPARSGRRLQPPAPVVTGALTGESASQSVFHESQWRSEASSTKCPQCGAPLLKLPFFVYCVADQYSRPVVSDWER